MSIIVASVPTGALARPTPCADCDTTDIRAQRAVDPALAALRQRDREVRAHELAHQAVGGPHAGHASFIYVTGPDGRRYAVGGSVAVDVSPESDPSATIAKMERIRRAALAPAQPSAADRAIAVQANREISLAQHDLRIQQQAEAAYAASTAAAAEDRATGALQVNALA